MGSKEKRRANDDSSKPSKKKSKHSHAEDCRLPSPPLCHALYIFLQQCGLVKTAERLAKELSQDFSESTTAPSFTLQPLFQRIDQELAAEKKQSRTPKKETQEETSPQIATVEGETPIKSSRKAKKEKAAETKAPGPLSRLDLDHWNKKATADNSWSAKGGDLFAEKAAKELGRVRGKDFRSEKAKKKRATWNGQGAIDMRTNSIKYFDSD